MLELPGSSASSSNSRGRRWKSTLVLVEHKDGKVLPATLHAVTAAGKLGFPVTALVTCTGGAAATAGKGAATAISTTTGITSVILVKGGEGGDGGNATGLPEQVAPWVQEVVKAGGFTHVLAAHSAFGKNVMPRAAALLDVGQVSDVIAIDGPDTFKRPIYAGNAIAQVRVKDGIKFLTIRTTAFPPAVAGSSSAAAPVKEQEGTPAKTTATWVSEELSKSDRPELGAAKVVVSGGRGMGNGKNFDMLYKLADKLGGAVGASRAAVDAGYVGNDLQIGQTGKIIAPQVYIAVGISGAIQHLAGMKDSKVIMAINKDAEAPIFQVADFGLVGDLFTVVPELTEKV